MTTDPMMSGGAGTMYPRGLSPSSFIQASQRNKQRNQARRVLRSLSTTLIDKKEELQRKLEDRYPWMSESVYTEHLVNGRDASPDATSQLERLKKLHQDPDYRLLLRANGYTSEQLKIKLDMEQFEPSRFSKHGGNNGAEGVANNEEERRRLQKRGNDALVGIVDHNGNALVENAEQRELMLDE